MYITFNFEFTATETNLKLSQTYNVIKDVREHNKAWVMFWMLLEVKCLEKKLQMKNWQSVATHDSQY